MTAATHGLTCRQVTDSLGAYLAGELRAKQRGAVDAHLVVCRDCRTYLEQYEQTRRLARASCGDAVEPGLPEELVAAILAARSVAPDDE